MSHDETKCVLVLNDRLPLGLAANTAAILGVTLGKFAPEMVGSNVADGSDIEHLGIVTSPVPILKAGTFLLQELRDKTLSETYTDLLVVGFSDTAQSCKTYEEYQTKLKKLTKDEYSYFGLGIFGERKKVNRLTGSFPLLK